MHGDLAIIDNHSISLDDVEKRMILHEEKVLELPREISICIKR